MKRLTLIFISLAIIMTAAAPIAAADLYEADIDHSAINFTIRHMMISKVHGHFREFAVQAWVDENDPSKCRVEAVIKTASIDTGNEKRDAHLRSADFFDAAKYPETTFKSSKVVKSGDGYLLTGILSMHGVSKELSFPFSVTGKITDPWGKQRGAVEATTTLDRKEYGISWNTVLDKGALMVGNEVTVQINLEAVKK